MRLTRIILACLLGHVLTPVSVDSQSDTFYNHSFASVRALEPRQEHFRWERISNRVPDNRYLPEIYRAPVGNEVQRQRFANLLRILESREALVRGTASNDEARFYFASMIEDVKQEIQLMTLLQLELRRHAAKTDAERILKLNEEIESLRRMLSYYQKRERGLPKTSPKVSSRVAGLHLRSVGGICIVDSLANVRCASLKQLVNHLIYGEWIRNEVWRNVRFDDARLFQILKRLDLIGERLGVSIDKLAVNCASDFWYGIQINKGISDPKTTDVLLLELSQLIAVQRTCSIADSGHLGQLGNPPGGGTDGWMQNTINQIDQENTQCTDSGDPRLGVGPLVRWAIERVAKTLGGKGLKKLEESLRGNAMTPEAAEGVYNEGVRAVKLTDEAAKVNEDAEDAQKKANEEQDPVKKTKLQQAAAQAAALAARKRREAREAACRASGREVCNDYGDHPVIGEPPAPPTPPEPIPPPPEPSPDPTPPTPPPPVPDGQLEGVRYSTCASRQASWRWFKNQCDRRNGWNRPGDICNRLLRKKNGCVDTLLINPGPDGDRTCIRGDISPEQAQQMACEERKKLMTPSEHFSVTCDDLTRPTLARTYDICHDPRARPTDDTTCAGSHGLPPGTSFGQGPQPKPYAMTVQETVLSDLNLLRP